MRGVKYGLASVTIATTITTTSATNISTTILCTVLLFYCLPVLYLETLWYHRRCFASCGQTLWACLAYRPVTCGGGGSG